MATLKSAAFIAQEAYDLANQRPDSIGAGHGLFYDGVSFPSAVAAGDNMILGYLDNRYPLPERGDIYSDGGATALTVDLGYGEYNSRTGVLTVTDADAFAEDSVLSSAGLVSNGVAAGASTRVSPSIGKPNESSRVVILTAVSETLGENATLSISLPCSPVATS